MQIQTDNFVQHRRYDIVMLYKICIKYHPSEYCGPDIRVELKKQEKIDNCSDLNRKQRKSVTCPEIRLF